MEGSVRGRASFTHRSNGLFRRNLIALDGLDWPYRQHNETSVAVGPPQPNCYSRQPRR